MSNQFAPGAVMSFTGTSGDHVRFELLGTTQTLGGIDDKRHPPAFGVIQNYEQALAALVNYNTSTLVLNGSGSYVFSGYLRNSTGQLSLTKNGTGTQTLSGGNISYTGSTAVNAGVLLRFDQPSGYSLHRPRSTPAAPWP